MARRGKKKREWISKLQSFYVVEYYAVIQEIKLLVHATWMNQTYIE